MSDNKKYYYLKLKDDFFDTDEMIVLESMQDGWKYSNILLKLYLRSLKNEGKLMFNNTIPFNSQMLASVTRHSVGDVEKAVKIFRELGLIEVLDNGAIYITEIQNFIGRSSTEADRKREYRNKIEAEKLQLLDDGQMSDKCPDKTPPEKEIELEIELEKDIKAKDVSSSDEQDRIPFKEIVDYLNLKANKKFRATSADTKKLIKARWNEGYKLDDFKRVIDNKCFSWERDVEMSKYLRPKTLFGTKFESYLNENQIEKANIGYTRTSDDYAGTPFG